ncbi:MAG: acyltransferase domain-containing protein [Ketobacteraceae bacterium]|nr:acyltransferase domain-containing protein [Ketobacteraceae bacterium]
MNVLMMPGIDALDSLTNRLFCLEIPEAVECLKQTQMILDDLGYPMDLFEAMRSEPRADFSWYHQLMICSFSVQVGLFRRFENSGRKIDAVFSMSLGDIPRCVCVDAGSYESALKGLVTYLKLTENLINTGNTLQIILPRPYARMKHHLRLEEYRVAISVDQSDYFFLLAGEIEDIERWDREVGSKLNITVRRPFSVSMALHHSLMNPVFDGLQHHIHESVSFARMKYPVFSTVLARYIKNQDELVDDIDRTIRSTVRFKQSVRAIMREHKRINFINIGPAPTMLLFLDYCYLRGKYTTEDYFETTLKDLGLRKPARPLKKRLKRQFKTATFKFNKNLELLRFT